MCYDRLVNDEAVTEMSVAALFRSELFCALRNGALAGVMVLGVLLYRGAPTSLVVGSVLGAVALGMLLHQSIFLAGAGVQRARARWRGTDHTVSG